MTTEQLFSALLLLVGALYAGLLWEVRNLRKAKHRDAQYIQWCCMALSLCMQELNIHLEPPKFDK